MMKKSTLFLLAVVLMAAFSPFSTILAQPNTSPHENPETTTVSPGWTTLLESYGTVFSLSAANRHQDAQSTISGLKEFVPPDELKYLLENYNHMSERLVSTNNKIGLLLNRVSELLVENRREEARSILEESRKITNDAALLAEDVRKESEKIAVELGIFSLSSSSPIRRSYDYLIERLDRLDRRIGELVRIQQDLKQVPKEITGTGYYIPTRLAVSAPETVYPGIPAIISGQITSEHGNAEREVSITLNDVELAGGKASPHFNLEIVIPPQTPAGEHSLEITAAAQERYAAATRRLRINVTRVPLRAELELPGLVIIPGPIRVKGKVFRQITAVPGGTLPDTSFQDVQVEISYAQSSAKTDTAADGSFSSQIKTSFGSLTLFGVEEMNIMLIPAEPWYAPTRASRKIIVLHPLSLGLVVIGFVSLGVMVGKRAKTRSAEVQERQSPAPKAPRKWYDIRYPPEAKRETTDAEVRVLTAYYSALRAIEKRTGAVLTEPTTLREFLTAIAPQLPAGVQAFAELTSLAEFTLYSNRAAGDDTALRAGKLAETIEEEMRGEAA